MEYTNFNTYNGAKDARKKIRSFMLILSIFIGLLFLFSYVETKSKLLFILPTFYLLFLVMGYSFAF
ncbi:hypothetical protein PV797_09265 [Clostridiaceae bacterium M8S5]|nr:hypothetical protein PV797_09265 [Clostridiaceae bacterium M8S5]